MVRRKDQAEIICAVCTLDAVAPVSMYDCKKGECKLLFRAEHFTMVAGTGSGAMELNAFDSALQAAGVGNYNLIRVSSILPPQAQEMSDIDVALGSLLPIAYGSIISGDVGREIAAAVAVGIPADRKNVGVIMEYSGSCDQRQAVEKATAMVKEAMDIRKIAIDEIKFTSCGCTADAPFRCAFAGIALW